jgi:hypothetical protein
MSTEDVLLETLREVTSRPVPRVPLPQVTVLRNDCAPPEEGSLYPYQRHVRQVLAEMAAAPRNLLVASPTGSGKTFAIEEAARRVLRGSEGETLYIAQPLIALAEQVYSRLGGAREPRLALRTGPSRKGLGEDICVTVCTYEVLARICMSAPQALDPCRLFIIDEVHYIASDRGPVIHEILQAASHKSIVALSGTLPNRHQFAQFLSSINGLPTFVAGADSRPVALTYYMYDASHARCTAMRFPSLPPRIDADDIGGLNGRQDLLSMLRVLESHDSLPLLVVLFSCRKLDQMAAWATSNNYLTASERSKVVVAFSKMLRAVPEEEHELFTDLRAQALRGIGRHHSHLPVPYLELLCRLAELRLVKVVFSSSTLSAGINLPVRTVALCGARMPQKDSAGDVSFELLSPLLFQQLAGRAGRPGFEAEGYCVIVGKNAGAHATAQGLVMRPPTAVVPRDDMTIGDVLRGRQARRNIGYDKALFCDPTLRAAVHCAVEARRDADSAVAACCTQTELQAGKLVAEAIETILANPSLLPLAREVSGQGAISWLSFTEDGQAVVSSQPTTAGSGRPAPSDGDAIPLSHTSGRAAAMPMQSVEEVLAVRQALRVVRDASDRALALASIECALARREAAFGRNPMVAEEARLARQIPARYLSERGALTDLGLAACNIRSVADPCQILDLVLEAGLQEPLDLAVLLSSALGEGNASPPSSEGALAAVVSAFPALSRMPVLTESALVDGIALWMSGHSVASVVAHTSVSAGVFSRHVVRVHDLLEEVRQAVSLVGATRAADICQLAMDRIARGLPFLKRGTGRVNAMEEDDDTEA